MDMGDELGMIWLLAIGLGLACLFGYLAQRAKQSPIIGYLLAGYLLGPHSPGFVADAEISKQLASIGITLLMFAVGLNFKWKDLIAVQKIALPGGLILSFLSILAGTLYSVFLGESWTAGMIIGVAICVSSTVVIVRVLTDQGLLHTTQGHIVVGWTIVEDLISIFGLLLLPSLVSSTNAADNPYLTIFYQMTWVLFKIAVLGLFIYFLGSRIIEWVLKGVSRTRSHELFTLAILASTFLIALFSSYLFGVSLALGAFIAGTIVGKTDMSHQAAANALPMRDTFAVIFFLSVGMLFNPLAVMVNLPLFFGILTILLILRPILAFYIVRAYEYPKTIAFSVALAIGQIGEYSFILAEEGNKLGILPENAFDIIVASSFITIGLNPLLFQLFQPYYKKHSALSDRHHIESLSTQGPAESTASTRPRAIVIGFGPIGQEASKHLLKRGYQVLVIDRNIDTISSLKEHDDKVDTMFGDATQSHILENAKIKGTKLLVITTPDFNVTQSIIQAARDINKKIKIVARSHFKSDLTESTTLTDILTICDEETSSKGFISAINQHLK